MKILHINTKDTGGAANAIIRIHLALLDLGVDSKVLILQKTRNLPGVFQFNVKRKKSLFKRIKNRIDHETGRSKRRAFKTKSKTVEVFSFPTSEYDITEHPLFKEADIIQLNWVSGFLDEPSFFMKTRKQVIWRMADLYAAGGGNHYEKDFPFEQFQSELKKNLVIRRKALQNASLTLVPISEWTETKANKSDLLKRFRKKVIHNGIDLTVFKPLASAIARNIFSLPPDKKILLFGAEGINTKRKGFDLLMQSLALIDQSDIQLCVFGSNTTVLGADIINTGNISDERLLAILYSAADLFIQSSIEETFGQVIIEAMAVGTPVISFPNGGALDAIIDGVTGIVATDFTAAAMAAAIEQGLKTNFDRDRIIQHVVSNFDIREKAILFKDLYETILNLPSDESK